MKILFNISPAVRFTTGIGTYTKELLNHLLQIDKKNYYMLFAIKSPFFNRRLPFSYTRTANVNYKSWIFSYRYFNIICNKLKLFSIEKAFGKIDILHSLDKIAPFTKKTKVVISLHDMAWYRFSSGNKKRSLIFQQIMETLKRATAIITVSEFSKNEIIKYLPFTQKKVYSINNGVSERFRPIDRNLIPGDIRTKYPMENYILYIGCLDEPRKNVTRILSAYARLKKRKKIKEKLLLCGQFSEFKADFLRLIRKINLPDDIIMHTKWIADEDVPFLYNKAKLALLPSLYEGFGLPILESMACGVPVITSNISPMKEIASHAALLVNPRDENELANSIETVLSDTALYDSLVRKGLERKNEFRWEKTARETLKVYEKCVNM